MPGFNVANFRANGLVFGGARPCLFLINLTFPPAVSLPTPPNNVQMVARAASLPSSIIDRIDIPYFGRRIKINGNRVFDDWECTIMNDQDFSLRNAFEEWHNLMNTIISNRMDPSVMGEVPTMGDSYKTIAQVVQFSQEGPGDIDGPGAIKTYTFDGIWPIQVSDIPLDWDATNQVEQFSVRFAYDWWEPSVTASGEPIFPIELNPA